ncbi:Adipocyte plasma membrane-associated protein [Aphelenchoides besseyi]|nr:Adipocyte plasma membrane-associated protein [Aphelenchoides besseyi]
MAVVPYHSMVYRKKPRRRLNFAFWVLLLLHLSFLLTTLWLVYRLLISDFNPKPVRLAEPPLLEGGLQENRWLQNASLIAKSQVLGPESLYVEENTIYTGTWDGKIVKIVNATISKVLRLVECDLKCGTYEDEPICGRPMGIRRLNSREFVVADAYLGIFVVNFEDESIRRIFTSNQTIDEVEPRFLNDLDVLNEHTIIVSHSTAKYDRRRYLLVFMEQNPNGRLLKVNVNTGEAEILASRLRFPNGVQIHSDRESVLVAETSMAQIRRIFISGERKGQSEIFAQNLPGYPDNIRLSTNKTLLIGLQNPRLPFETQIIDATGPRPWMRKFLAALVPERFLRFAINLISPSYGLAIELDLNGTIVRSYHDPDGRINDISQISDHNGFLYLGSFHGDYIAKVPK